MANSNPRTRESVNRNTGTPRRNNAHGRVANIAAIGNDDTSSNVNINTGNLNNLNNSNDNENVNAKAGCLELRGGVFWFENRRLQELKPWMTRGDSRTKSLFRVGGNANGGRWMMLTVRPAPAFHTELSVLERVTQYGLPNYLRKTRVGLCGEGTSRLCAKTDIAQYFMCPGFARSKQYGFIESEMCSGDMTLAQWMAIQRPPDEYVSVLVQSLFALGMMHMDGLQHGRVTAETVVIRTNPTPSNVPYRVSGLRISVRTRVQVILTDFAATDGARDPHCDVLHLLAILTKPQDRVLVARTKRKYPIQMVANLIHGLTDLVRRTRCNAKNVLVSPQMHALYESGKFPRIILESPRNAPSHPLLNSNPAHPWLKDLRAAWLNPADNGPVGSEMTGCGLPEENAHGPWMPEVYRSMNKGALARMMMFARPDRPVRAIDERRLENARERSVARGRSGGGRPQSIGGRPQSIGGRARSGGRGGGGGAGRGGRDRGKPAPGVLNELMHAISRAFP